MHRRVRGGIKRHPFNLRRIETGNGGDLVEVIVRQRLAQGGGNRFDLTIGPGRAEVFRIEYLETFFVVEDKESAIAGDGLLFGLQGKRLDIPGQQPFAGILADKDWIISKIPEKFRIVEPAVNDDFGHAQAEGGIGIRLDRHPFVGLGRGAAEIRIDDHHPASPFGLEQVMGIGQPRLDDIRAENEGRTGIDPLQGFQFLALHPESHRPEHRQIAEAPAAKQKPQEEKKAEEEKKDDKETQEPEAEIGQGGTPLHIVDDWPAEDRRIIDQETIDFHSANVAIIQNIAADQRKMEKVDRAMKKALSMADTLPYDKAAQVREIVSKGFRPEVMTATDTAKASEVINNVYTVATGHWKGEKKKADADAEWADTCLQTAEMTKSAADKSLMVLSFIGGSAVNRAYQGAVGYIEGGPREAFLRVGGSYNQLTGIAVDGYRGFEAAVESGGGWEEGIKGAGWEVAKGIATDKAMQFAAGRGVALGYGAVKGLKGARTSPPTRKPSTSCSRPAGKRLRPQRLKSSCVSSTTVRPR
jgi:hypothetical protein